jgi:nucleoside-diphosphate-sugar epimerase
MKILVTGSNGFIGSHLTEKMLELGNQVTCIVRNKSNLQWLSGVKGNSNLNLKMEVKNLDSYDKVYHIAGVLGKKEIPLIEYVNAHVKMTYELLVKMSKGQHFIYISSAWVHIVDKPYELTKLDGEYVVKASGVDYTIVRPGFIYGERDMHHLQIYKMIKWFGAMTPIIGTGKNKICPTYVKDVVNSLVNCERNRTFYPVGLPITVRQYMNSIADIMKIDRSRITLRYIPDFMKDFVKWDFFTSERVFPSNINPTPLMQGLANTIKWYKANRYL